MIKLEQIKKTYEKRWIKTEALRGIDLEVSDGEMLAIMGASGSGKSTLLNIIGAVDTATSGDYYFDDVNVTALKGKDFHEFRKKNIGFVFQRFELMPRYTVYENVEMPLLVRNIKNRKDRVYEALEKVGLKDHAKKYAEHLSGGQQQRCAIARAVTADVGCILADEPTGALDSRNSEEIMKLFDGLHNDGKTIIIVTHEKEIARHADRVVKIEDGRIEC